MDKKLRLSVYLDPEVMHALAGYADRRNQSRSVIAEAAIASFLSPDAEERSEAASVKRLDRLDRRVGRLERDFGIAVGTLAVFVLFWLASTPQLPDSPEIATQAKIHERYGRFLETLGRRLADGPTLRQEIAEDVQGH
jgi:predicted transcriptional regulator